MLTSKTLRRVEDGVDDHGVDEAADDGEVKGDAHGELTRLAQ